MQKPASHIIHFVYTPMRVFFLGLLAATSFTCSLWAQDVEVSANVGHMIANNLRDNMPGLAGSAAGQALAERIGDITYTGVSTINGQQSVDSANGAGTISATVTVSNTGTFNGSVTVGSPGTFGGTIGGSTAQTVVGTHNMSISWSTSITDDGYLRIEYIVAVGQEARQGAFKLPIKVEHLVVSQASSPPPDDWGGNPYYEIDLVAWYNEQFEVEPEEIPDGEVEWGDIIVISWEDPGGGYWQT